MLKTKVGGDTVIDLSDKIYPPKAVPTFTWNPSEKHIQVTALTEIRKHFNYTEPVYTKYLKSWLNVHPNQYQAGCEILDLFWVGVNSVILTAEMQSGKTGTVRYVAHALLHLSGPERWNAERYTSDRTYFICGMNDNDLRTQAITEFQDIIPAENILFSKQLQKINTECNGDALKRASLVIVDESHYASQNKSQVDKFLSKLSSDVLLLSVSATAMAELATSEQLGKGTVYLRPGAGYFSINDLFRNNMIKQSVDITNEQKKFTDLVAYEYEKQLESSDKKYNIVRLPSQWYYQDLEDDLIDDYALDIDFINHHAGIRGGGKAQDFNKYLESAPEKFTIIWIYGSLRAGKQLFTKHVGFVHDTASSSPDIIAQSLLGRILGYNKEYNFVQCYTDVNSAKLFQKWINHTFDIAKIPKGSRYVINGHSNAVKKWHTHPPFCVKLSDDMRVHYRRLKQIHGNRYPYKTDFLEELIDCADIDRSDVEEILTTYQPGHCGGLMILTEDNKLKSFNEHWGHNYVSFLKSNPVRCCEETTPGRYFYVYVNLNVHSVQYGLALVTYMEYINAPRDSLHVKVNNRSRFAVR